MSNSPIQLAVIIGSTREGRFGPTVADWFVNHAEQRDDMSIDVIDLAEAELPVAPSSSSAPDAAKVLASVSSRPDAADAFVVVTPEYNHSFPASLKNVIDCHYTQWQAKPVGFVSYGAWQAACVR